MTGLAVEFDKPFVWRIRLEVMERHVKEFKDLDLTKDEQFCETIQLRTPECFDNLENAGERSGTLNLLQLAFSFAAFGDVLKPRSLRESRNKHGTL